MLLSATLMASCTTLANIIVEDTIQDMVNHPGKTQGSTSTTKALDKERIQMIKEGKCPVCRFLSILILSSLFMLDYIIGIMEQENILNKTTHNHNGRE